MSRRYLLITPCRDEADYLQTTIDTVTAQTVPPSRWIIVDDGSTDGTPAILAAAAREHRFVEVVRREDRGTRAVGPGVVDAFYAGLERVDLDEFDYVAKIDADLELPERYFETLMERMEREPAIGTCSGKPYFRDEVSGRLISEKCGDEMSVGMIKFYDVACFRAIDGFVREVMWDGIDCHRCRMLGYVACSWDDDETRFIHLRPMGSSQKGMLRGRMRHGFGQYFMGTGFAYMAVSALYRMSRPPLIVGGLAMLWGYVRSWMGGVRRDPDLEFRRFLRHYQWRCLLRGKRRATETIHRRIMESPQPPSRSENQPDRVASTVIDPVASRGG